MTPAEAKALLAGLPARVADEVGTALDSVAGMAAAETRRLLGETLHRPSSTGQPPADLTGALAAAVSTVGVDGGAQVVVAAPFAADLEYGTRRMAARPFLRPAVAATVEPAREALAAAVSRAVDLAVDGSA